MLVSSQLRLKSRGRPAIDQETPAPARVHVTIASTDYDRARRRANREGISVPELVRRGLARELAENDD